MSRPCDPSGRVSALPLAVSAADFACFRLRRRQRGLRRAPTLANSILMVAAAAAVAQAATCPFNGGWSLRVDAAACPPSAPIACGAGIQPRCCPSGLQCAGDGDYVGNYCCPPGVDCRADASRTPQCPDPTWTLWGVNGAVDGGGWCCLAGATGAYQNSTSLGNSYGVGCYAASKLARENSLAAGLVVPTVACTTSSTASSTASSSTASSSTVSSSTASSTTTSAATTSAATTGPTSGTSGGDGVASTGGGLSGGAIAGVAIGALAGVALLGLLGFFLLRRNRRRGTGGPAVPPQEAYGKEVNSYGAKPYQVYEMPMQAAAERYELAGR